MISRLCLWVPIHVVGMCLTILIATDRVLYPSIPDSLTLLVADIPIVGRVTDEALQAETVCFLL